MKFTVQVVSALKAQIQSLKKKNHQNLAFGYLASAIQTYQFVKLI